MSAEATRVNVLGALKASAGPIRVPMGVRALFGILILIGVATFFVEKASDPTGTYAAFLLGYTYFLMLGLGGTFFVAIHYITGATWSVAVRRVAEGMGSYLPVALVLLLALLFGI